MCSIQNDVLMDLLFFNCRVNLIAHTIGISISWIDETHLNSMLLCIFFSYFFVGVRGHTQLSRPVRRYINYPHSITARKEKNA
jgi:hypothetical protein